jgi:hypothetical protein
LAKYRIPRLQKELTMRYWLAVAVLVLSTGCSNNPSTPAPAPLNVAGNWAVTITGSQGALSTSGTIALQQNGTTLTGNPATPAKAIRSGFGT